MRRGAALIAIGSGWESPADRDREASSIPNDVRVKALTIS